MNIHEYQGKALLKSFGAPVAEGVPVFKASEAEAAAKALPGPLYVVKSQIHAGAAARANSPSSARTPRAACGWRNRWPMSSPTPTRCWATLW